MSISPSDFKAPYIPQSEVWSAADEFRAKYWKGDLPVDVILLDDWQTLVVDQGYYLDDRYQNRIRFSVAHELGHYVMHRTAFQKIPRATAEEWIAFTLEISEREYSFLESHANEFAGRFLVPPEELRAEFQAAIRQVEESGLPREKLREDSQMQYLAKPIARRFEVSSSVIERRLSREKLWPLS